MTDTALPMPEPTKQDEVNLQELQILAADAVLKGHPYGDERCKNCLYYLSVDESISYCWHPKLQVLVGEDWWCQWWEQAPADT